MYPFVTVPPIGWTVRASDLIVALTAVLAVTLAPAWIRSAGRFDGVPVRRICALLFLAAFLGARLLFVATHLEHYWQQPLAVLDPHPAGRNAPGALLVLVVVAPLVLRRRGIAPGRFLDAGVPVMCVLLALSRVGCLLHGCCVGSLCEWPWCAPYPRGSAFFNLEASLGWIGDDAPFTHAVHLLPAYFALAALAVAGIGHRLNRSKRFDWQVTAVAMLLLGTTNAILEGWRLEIASRTYWGPWPYLVWVNLGLAVGGAMILAVPRTAHDRSRSLAGTREALSRLQPLRAVLRRVPAPGPRASRRAASGPSA